MAAKFEMHIGLCFLFSRTRAMDSLLIRRFRPLHWSITMLVVGWFCCENLPNRVSVCRPISQQIRYGVELTYLTIPPQQ
jgi:hypothetical protein